VSIFWDEEDDRLLCCEAQKQRVFSATAPNGSNRPASATGGGAAPSGSKSSKNKKGGGDADLVDENNGNSSAAAAREEAAVAAAAAAAEEQDNEIEVVLFFVTSEHGILMQDSFLRKQPYGPMVGLSVPRLYFRNVLPTRRADEMDDEDANGNGGNGGAGGVNSKVVKIYSKVMRDFVGMDDVKEATKTALLDFSYNLTLGKLDEAYRVVKTINSPSVWENMAQMCVKTKRLDVAEVCLGNMGHARGAAAVRDAKRQSEGSVEVAVGMLAIQLGLLDDAAQLFREAGRFDMLNKLYQAAGLWDKAILTAKAKDRIHLKATHYQFAKHLESLGLTDEAIEHYQLSQNATTEVPRMLFQLDRVDELGEYVLQSDDPVLLKWWAAYLESIERYDKAKKYYNKAKDYLSLVRICCFKV
jgi:intraflagellar transport protein 140